MKRIILLIGALTLVFTALPALAQDTPTATLGISYRPNGDVGVVITGLADDGPASNAGVEVGDTLVAIDGTFVNALTLPDTLATYSPTDRVTLLIIREGETLRLEVPLGSRADTGGPGLVIGDEEPVILGVSSGSSGDDAGLEIGDRLVFINGQQITDGISARAALETLLPGETATLIIDRDGDAVVRQLEIGEANDLLAMTATPAQDTDESSVAFLGVGLDDSEGFPVVTQVIAGSPAAEAGVMVGEVIRSINDTNVSSTEDVQRAVRQNTPGDTIYLVLWQDARARLIFVTLDER